MEGEQYWLADAFDDLIRKIVARAAQKVQIVVCTELPYGTIRQNKDDPTVLECSQDMEAFCKTVKANPNGYLTLAELAELAREEVNA